MNKRILFGIGLAAILATGIFVVRTTRSTVSDPAGRTAVSAGPSVTTNPVAPAQVAAVPGAVASARALSREMNPALNPYAAALREPGKSKRAWDPQFINQFKSAVDGDPIRFELPDGRTAVGTIRLTQLRDGQISYLSGELTQPEKGKFFFLTPPAGGKAGKAVGVIELAASSTAYRIEPTGLNGEPELWQRRMDEVLCLNLPHAPDAPQSAAAAQADPTPENIPPLRPDLVPNYVPSYNSNIVSLQSYPGSQAVLLLDFFGGYTPTWGGVTYPAPNVSNDVIKDLWKRVAEDFMPFNINVTTDLKVYQNAPATSRQRCAFTIASSKNPLGDGGAGVAYIGSWNWGSDTPCWSGYTSGKNGAEVGAHEPGHTLGLSHDGADNNGVHTEYYGGQGSGATGWAPIMGVGYGQLVVTWCKGEYQYANNQQDQLNMIVTQNNNVRYRPDDTGDTLATSRYLEVYSNNTATAEGVIETTGDTDAFQFTTRGGTMSLTASPVGDWGDVALMASLYDSADNLIVSNNPQSSLSAGITRALSAGTYTFRVTGMGRNDPFTTGFSAYASLGYYSISGSVVGARLPTRFSIGENSPVGRVVGSIPPVTSNGDALTYNITSDNSGGAFVISNGVLVVSDNSQFNYETLALKSPQPVQFEMFVDIIDNTTPTLTETNRRVVVAITNVNEAPLLAGFSTQVLEHTAAGTVVGTVTGSDPDFYTTLNYSIVSGNSNSMFAIDNATGTISVAGDLNAASQSVYHLTVQVSDQTPPLPLTANAVVTITVIPNPTGFRTGTIAYTVYTNITGNLISALTGATIFPYDPAFEKQLTQTEADSNWGQNYGGVMRGYLIPPVSGDYTFWIATDDNGELWLSPSTNAAGMVRRAYISGDNNYAGPREWTKFSTQQSPAITLAAGQAYYFEARLKQGTGGDNFAVAWQCAAGGISRDVIPGRFIAPYSLNYTPHGIGFASALHKNAFAGARVGTVGVTDVNANDQHTFAITGGNPSGVFGINPTNGTIRVANEAALAALNPGIITLSVKVSDNGSPARSSLASVTLNVAATNAITATSLQQEIWNNISDTTVAALTGAAAYPKRPDAMRALTGFDSGKANYGDNYGSRIRALLTPATNGSYNFYISSDDNSQLKFSTTTNPATATVIASVSDYSDYQQWTKFASQTSASINLVAGKQYYIETLHKEGGGGDHVEIAWSGPGMTAPTAIAASLLTPVDLNFPPDLAGKSATLLTTATNGALATTLTGQDSALDTLTYKILSGNSSGTFALNSETGALTVADNTAIANRNTGKFTLTVQVQDSGYGDLFPRKATNATVSIVISEAPAVYWTGNGSNNNWSVGANWNGTAPLNSSPLTFAGSNRQTNVNDLLTLAGTVRLQNGGFQITGQPLTLRAGLTSIGDNTWALDTTLSKWQTIVNSSGTLTFAGALDSGTYGFALGASDTLLMKGPIRGSGPLTISGPGKIVVGGSHPFSGQIAVTSGTLALTDVDPLSAVPQFDVSDGAVLDASALSNGLNINSAQTLSGSGVVLGNTVIQGTLSPGDFLGTLTFSNNLTLAGSTVVEFNKSDAGLTNDVVTVAGALKLGGALGLTNSGGPLAAGDVLAVFNAASLSGGFDSMDLPSPGPGLTWNTGFLNIDGTIRVETAGGPRIGAIWQAGRGLALTFPTTVGVTYVVQTAPDLTAPVQWSNVSTNVGDGADLTLTNAAQPSETQRYYRILTY